MPSHPALRLTTLLLATASILCAQQPAPSNTTTLHVSVRRVVVDVVVTDSSGKPVKNLARNDFRIFEDAKPEQLRSFDEHTTESQPPLPTPTLPPDTFSNLSTAPQTGPVTVILYDLLNTPLEAQPFARAQLLQFLKNRKASNQTAIFVLTDKLHMLQGFTDDEDQLLAALNNRRTRGYKSSDLQAPGEATAQSESLARTAGNDSAASGDTNASFQAIATALKHMETIESSAILDQRVRITADSLQEIARFLIALPGRKNLLWLSGSFPTGILPDDTLAGRDSFEVTRNYSTTLVQTTDLLNLSHVAVYPVDVRGLQVNPMFSAASNRTFPPGTGKDTQALRDFAQQTAAEHATMDVVADGTGGHAFYNTNGLKEAVAAAVEDGSHYYTLTYAPANTTLDGKARHVKVELLKPGYQLSYRRTYFADTLDDKVQASEDNPADPFNGTLQHGAPTARELFVEAHLQTYGTPTLATPQQLQVLADYDAKASNKKRKPSTLPSSPVLMQRYIVTYGLLPRQLQISTDANSVRHTNLEFAILSYDDDGKTLNGIRSTIADSITPQRYQHLLDNGYQVVQTIAVPAQTAFLRLAVRDSVTRQMGSFEVHLPLPKPPQTTP